jgi:hypothetical protein
MAPRAQTGPKAARSEAYGRSTIRRVGVVLTAVGVAVAAFSGAAGIGGVGLAFGLAFTGAGFMLWVVGILEDRLIEIREAVVFGAGHALGAASIPLRRP